jgi:hypothetical protein
MTDENFEENDFTLETLSDELVDLQGRVEVQHKIIMVLVRALVNGGVLDADDFINRVNVMRYEPDADEAARGWAEVVWRELEGLYPSPSIGGSEEGQ